MNRLDLPDTESLPARLSAAEEDTLLRWIRTACGEAPVDVCYHLAWKDGAPVVVAHVTGGRVFYYPLAHLSLRVPESGDASPASGSRSV